MEHQELQGVGSTFSGEGFPSKLLQRAWLSQVSISDPRFDWFVKVFRPFLNGRISTLQHLVDALTVSSSINRQLGNQVVADLFSQLDTYGQSLSGLSLEDELLSVLETVVDSKYAPFLAHSFGWTGKVGDTRSNTDISSDELQLAATAADEAMRARNFWLPTLDRALELLHSQGMDSSENIERRLRRAGIAESDVIDDRGLQRACEIFGKTIPPAVLVRNLSSQQGTSIRQSLHPRWLDFKDIERRSFEDSSFSPALQLSQTDALSHVSAWAFMQRGVTSLGDLITLMGSDEPIPGDTRTLWTAFLKSDCSSIGAQQLRLYDPIAGFREVQQYFLSGCGSKRPPSEGRRLWTILVKRAFPSGKPATLQELGDELGVTRERVRQLESRVESEIRIAMSSEAGKSLLRAASSLRHRLGKAFPKDQITSSLNLQFDLNPDMVDYRTTIEDMLIWISGPYSEVLPGWLGISVDADLPGRSISDLLEATSDGPISAEVAFQLVEQLGVTNNFAEAWVEALGLFKFMDGNLVRWSGAFADKAEQILLLAGQPLTREELLERVGGNYSRGPVQLLTSDERFVRTSRYHYGLRSWGFDEYSTIEEEIAEEIDYQGGQATANHLVTTLATKFHVSENSVRQYLSSSPSFSRTEDGCYVNLARKFSARQPKLIGLTRGCIEIKGEAVLRVVVTPDTLRGSGSGIPSNLAVHLGAAVPGTKSQFRSSVGLITVSSTPTGAAISSLRMAANAVEAMEGDLLFLRFKANQTVDFARALRSDIEQARGLQRLLLEIGLTSFLGNPVWEDLSQSLGFPEVEDTVRIRHRFLQRREPEFAQLLPIEKSIGAPSEDERQEDTLNEILRLI